MAKKKQIADHHDNVIRLKVISELIDSEFKYIRDKDERDDRYIKISRDRLVDMKINNYDKIIDLEMFLLKLFIPLLGISFAAGVNIFGIDTDTLKRISFFIIILVGFFISVTFIFRKRIINSEQKFYERQVDLINKMFTNKVEKLAARVKKLRKDLKLASENEPNL